MRQLAILGLVAVLAGCGADGEPETPTRNAGAEVSESGVSGSLSVGWVRGAPGAGRRF